MTFFNILKSLDELLYELMTWLVFYPVTLWRSIRRPLSTMAYARAELERDHAEQFRQTLSPPVFLLVTILLAHGIELAVVGNSQLVGNHNGLADLIDDDTSLIIFRALTFALFPVAMGPIETLSVRRTLDRATLREPFYAQCFLAAPYALVLSVCGTGTRFPNETIQLISVLALLLGTILYIWAETLWLARITKEGRGWSLLKATASWLGCVVLLFLVGSLLT